MTSFYENADQEGGDIDYTSEIQEALLAAQAAQAAAELAETNAETAATTASSYATAASVSASNASSSASAASSSATSAYNAQVAAEAARDTALSAAASVLPADAAGVLTNDGAGTLTWAAGGGAFDPTASQTITGEWAFEVLPAESFLVTDDPTLASPTFTFGVANDTLIPDNMVITAYADATSGIGYLAICNLITFEGQAAVNAKDAHFAAGFDGYSSAEMLVSNGNVSSQISIAETASDAPINITANKGAINITATGAATNDNITIEATNGKVNLVSDSGTNNGLSLKAGTNTTLFAVETHSSLGDYWSMKAGSSGVICPNMILNKDTSSGANIKLGIGTSTVYGLEITRTSANLITEKLYTPNGSITLTQDTDTSDASIALVTNGSGTCTLNGSAILTASNNVISGFWSPTITVVSGSFTANDVISYYTRIGNIVSVSVRLKLTATALDSSCTFRASMPISSNFSSATNATGTVTAFEPTNQRWGSTFFDADFAYDKLHCILQMNNGVGIGDVIDVAMTGHYIVQ